MTYDPSHRKQKWKGLGAMAEVCHVELPWTVQEIAQLPLVFRSQRDWFRMLESKQLPTVDLGMSQSYSKILSRINYWEERKWHDMGRYKTNKLNLRISSEGESIPSPKTNQSNKQKQNKKLYSTAERENGLKSTRDRISSRWQIRSWMELHELSRWTAKNIVQS